MYSIIDYWFIDFINRGSTVVLANAPYFKGTWDNRFTAVNDKLFYLNNKYQITVKIMTQIHRITL